MIALSAGSVSKEAKLAQKDNLDTHSGRVSLRNPYTFFHTCKTYLQIGDSNC